uniref:Uncharacterized protein n=1 Tax=Panagrellus redivivus TaxID=6233 RepID=A0A7E4VD09_PANRE
MTPFFACDKINQFHHSQRALRTSTQILFGLTSKLYLQSCVLAEIGFHSNIARQNFEPNRWHSRLTCGGQGQVTVMSAVGSVRNGKVEGHGGLGKGLEWSNLVGILPQTDKMVILVY